MKATNLEKQQKGNTQDLFSFIQTIDSLKKSKFLQRIYSKSVLLESMTTGSPLQI